MLGFASRRRLGAAALCVSLLISVPCSAQPPVPTPAVPPLPDPGPPLGEAIQIEPAPPAGPNPSEQASRPASEAFSSLGGFGAGPGGGIGALLSPTVGNMPVRASLGFTWFPSEDVRSQPASLGSYREDFAVSAPVWQND